MCNSRRCVGLQAQSMILNFYSQFLLNCLKILCLPPGLGLMHINPLVRFLFTIETEAIAINITPCLSVMSAII